MHRCPAVREAPEGVSASEQGQARMCYTASLQGPHMADWLHMLVRVSDGYAEAAAGLCHDFKARCESVDAQEEHHALTSVSRFRQNKTHLRQQLHTPVQQHRSFG